jgi:hypothetical protein
MRRKLVGLRQQTEKDEAKLDNQRARSEAYTSSIVKEQKGLVEAAQKRISKINRDLKALRIRMKAYVTKTPKARDERYYRLKDTYANNLQERAALQRAILVAEESITASELHHIPGEGER